ncbi:putative alpha crystallin/Hsp20 domain, HSP20-like chaperone [Helianthus anomalus]
MDQVKAAMENGVLTVTVPKVEEKKPELLLHIDVDCCTVYINWLPGDNPYL